MKYEKRTQKCKGIWLIISLLFLFISCVKVLDVFGSDDAKTQIPNYEKLDLEEYLNAKKVYSGNISENAEMFLYLQTGLTDKGIEEIRNSSENAEDFLKKLQGYQKRLFTESAKAKMVPTEQGDILVSISQRFCYYSHGHAALVVDEKKGVTIEAKSFQAGSCYETIKKWEKMNSFVVLRVKEECYNHMATKPQILAVNYAIENLAGLKYSLVKEVREISSEPPQYTQCAHLVWYAYYVNGLDIDENRGLVVKPKDFLQSDVLEVVQVYGINPIEILKIRNE